jgi:hypothetical protein
MKNTPAVLKTINLLIVFTLLLTTTIVPASPTPETLAIDKVNVDEVIAKHLEAIGSSEARAAINSRVMVGLSHVSFRVNGVSQADGKVVMASEGVKNLLSIVFGLNDYPHEMVGYDGKKVTAAQLRPSQYSVLGNFLLANNNILKEGLLGGTISSAWPLLDLKLRNPHVKYAGTTKVENRSLYKLEYLPRNGSDLKINIFIDSETFQHLRTEYEMVISAAMGNTPETSSRQTATRYRMVEDFSNFKKEGGLTLPHSYKLQLSIQARGTSFEGSWECDLSQFIFNKRIDIKEFNVAAQ